MTVVALGRRGWKRPTVILELYYVEMKEGV